MQDKPRLSRRKAAGRMELLDVAEQLFADQGYERISPADITAVAGYGRTTFYEYFTDKEDLLASLVEERLPVVYARFLEGIPPDLTAREQLAELAVRMVEFAVTDHTLGLMLHQELPTLSMATQHRIADAHSDLSRAFARLYQEAVAGDELRMIPADLADYVHEHTTPETELFERLRAEGFLADSVTVVTSDHGEAFREHGTVEHGSNLYPEVTGVPLVFAGEGRVPSGLRVRTQVRSIDVAPTLLGLAGLDVPEGIDGETLLPMDGDALLDRVAIAAVGLNDFAPDRDYVSVTTRDHFYVRDRRSGAVEFYDLRVDPGALEDLGADHPEAARLSSLVPAESDANAQRTALDPATREQLRALGYLDD